MIEIKTTALTNEDDFSRGVFAKRDISKSELIHEAPVIPYPNEQHDKIEETLLADYAFQYGEHHTAFVLGYGMMFNHSYTPNANYKINFQNDMFEFYAYKDIPAGEEILINYNGEVENDSPLWFDEDEE
ncbi:SET domain-containing protein [Halobacillus yeomjeoni]|uniref:SET domain-containing protein-lysine N-methyltransferase n=1 Tax=Halobacillus yeomjeoni TaxID=311194 RepID=A0A931MUL2_9BACI|nr:SET domain-containing protein [Halobacillus yeomjeoni]MBH0229394.1 SET domain-containing protein-lysine N-methyltransferase [Halobacillus yeomjeoni]MCA0983201.1 SET domain-containing protein [Halobacillus yeomjeoni]